MRLSSRERATIHETVREAFGQEACVRLFGSRLDDSARGGDIDLHIEAPGTPDELMDAELRLATRLQRALGERRIDLVVHPAGTAPRPIDRHALETGVLL